MQHGISWRLMLQGFRGLCRDFLKKHPRGYYVAPLRVTGSAVETLFGQFKFSTGGKLDAANYPVARAAFLMKQATQGHYGSGYRDIPLYTPFPANKSIPVCFIYSIRLPSLAHSIASYSCSSCYQKVHTTGSLVPSSESPRGGGVWG